MLYVLKRGINVEYKSILLVSGSICCQNCGKNIKALGNKNCENKSNFFQLLLPERRKVCWKISEVWKNCEQCQVFGLVYCWWFEIFSELLNFLLHLFRAVQFPFASFQNNSISFRIFSEPFNFLSHLLKNSIFCIFSEQFNFLSHLSRTINFFASFQNFKELKTAFLAPEPIWTICFRPIHWLHIIPFICLFSKKVFCSQKQTRFKYSVFTYTGKLLTFHILLHIYWEFSIYPLVSTPIFA